MRKNRKFKWESLMFVIILAIGIPIGLELYRKNIIAKEPATIVISGNFKGLDSLSQNTTEGLVDTTLLSTFNANGLENVSPNQVAFGSLSVINSQYSLKGVYNNLTVIEPLKNDCYTLKSSDMVMNSEAISHLNDMMTDYNNATEKSNLVVYNTTNLENSSLYTTAYPEMASGYSFDLAVISQSSGDTIAFDGLDSEGWINQNCHNYGFVVRYAEDKYIQTTNNFSPYHFRYVGLPHSLIMNEKNLCLEEYAELLKTYTAVSPFVYTSNSTTYNIFYMSANEDISMYSNLLTATISGNNYDGYIITMIK